MTEEKPYTKESIEKELRYLELKRNNFINSESTRALIEFLLKNRQESCEK